MQVGGGGGDPEASHMSEEEKEVIRKQLEEEMQVPSCCTVANQLLHCGKPAVALWETSSNSRGSAWPTL